jgi:HK97 family phage portal protein
MSRLQNAIKAFTETKSVKKSVGSFFGDSHNFNTRLTGQKQQLLAYRDWVYAAARAIAEDVATIDFELYVNRTGTKSAIVGQKMANPAYARALKTKIIKNIKGHNKPALEEIDDHILLDLLYDPNPFMTKDEFIEMTVLHMELAGESFWYIFRNSAGVPIEIWPLMPNLVQIKKDPVKFIAGYAYITPGGNTLVIKPEDIIHHKYTNPNDLYRGMGTVQAASRAIDTDSHAADWNRNFFYNSASPDIVLEADGTLSDDTWKRLKEDWESSYKGTDNAHRTAILEEGLKVKTISLAQRDMEFLEGRKFNRDQILALFRVSGAILGIQENSNRATAEAAEFTFAKRVIRPKMQRLVSRITQDLAPLFDVKLILSFQDPVPEDKEYNLKDKKTSINHWRTINEVRAENGDDPVKGGDVLYQPVNLMPLGVEAPAIEKPEEDKPEPKEPSDSEKQLLETNKTILKELEELKKKDLYATDEQREIVGEAFNTVVVKIAYGYEVLFLRKNRELFDKQKKIVLRNLKKRYNADKGMMPTAAKSVNLVNLIDTEASREAWYKGLTPIMRSNIADVGSEALLLVGSTGFDIDDPEVVRFYEKRGKTVSISINDETDKQLRTTLSKGIEAGESIDALANRVEDVYGSAAGYRAERIARTETIKASGFAQNQAWEQSGVVEAKEWFTSKDQRVCPFCNDMDRKTIGLNDNYFDEGQTMEVNGKLLKLDYWDIDTPPLHANCRCTLLPVLKEY